MNQTLLGIDIGGTKIACGVVRAANGEVLLQDRTPTRASEGGTAVLLRAIDLARRTIKAAEESGLPGPDAIGIGAGGQINAKTGVVLSATELLPGWAGIRLKEAFAETFGLPVAADNDVNAMAVGESRYGIGRGEENLVYLALGTGVGGAFLSGGRLHQSRFGVSGEMGHLILIPDGIRCTCGGRGCWEQYISGPALLRQYRERGGDASLTDGTPLAGMARQDASGPAARAIAQVAEYLGVGLVSLANIFGPDRVILSGGMLALGDVLLEPARRIVAQRALPAVRSVPIVTAALGADALLVGAASLALDSLGNAIV